MDYQPETDREILVDSRKRLSWLQERIERISYQSSEMHSSKLDELKQELRWTRDAIRTKTVFWQVLIGALFALVAFHYLERYLP